MKQKFDFFCFFIFLSISSITICKGQINKDYRSAGGGVTVDLLVNANWQMYNGTAWVAATQAPLTAATPNRVTSGNTVTIQAGDTWSNASVVSMPAGSIIEHKGLNGTFSGTNKITLNGSTYKHNTSASEATVAAGITFSTASTTIYTYSGGGTVPAVNFGSLTIASGCTYALAGAASVIASGTLRVDGTLNLGANALNVKTSLTASSTFTGSGTITGSATSGRIALGTGTANFLGTNVSFTGTCSGITVNAPITLLNDLTISGTGYTVQLYFNAAGAYIDLNGRTLTCPGTNGPNNPTFKNTSPGSLITSATSSIYSGDSNPFNNITLGAASQLGTNVTINGALTVNTGTLTTNAFNLTLGSSISHAVAAGAGITVSASGTLTNGGTLTNSGTLTNNGTITNTYGSIVVKSTASASGAFNNNTTSAIPNVTVQQWITGQRGYRILSNPFSTRLKPSTVGTANGITIIGANDVKTFNGITNTWTSNYGIDSIPANTPYSVFIRGLASEVSGLAYTAGPTAFAYGVTGTLNGKDGNNGVTINQNNTTANDWTIAGNPFAAPITSSALTGKIAGTAYYVYDITANNPSNARLKSGGWVPVASSDAKTIPMMGVVAYQAGTGASATFTVVPADINTGGTLANTHLFGETEASLLEIQLNQGSNYQDKLFVRVDANASDASNERMDLVKIANDVTNIYTISPDATHLAVDARKALDKTIPLGVTAPIGTYSFSVASNNLTNSKVYLIDKLLNTKTLLEAGATYSFDITADAASKGNNRFELGSMAVPVTDVITTNANFTVKVLGNIVKDNIKVQVQGAQGIVSITVTDLQGKILKTLQSTNGINTVIVNCLSNMYLVRVSDGVNTVVEKVVNRL